MKKHINSLVVITLMALITSSCKKFVEIDSPKGQLTADKVFADSTSANSALTGLYYNMSPAFGLGFATGGVTVYPGLSADELYQFNTDMNTEFYANNISGRNGTNASLWSEAYKNIYVANACIEGVDQSSGISIKAKALLSAEARCVRALLYFNLVNLYGDVPLVTGTDYDVNRQLPRAAAADVYQQILTDLKQAQSNLPVTTVKTERASYYSATALLAKVYLYQGAFDLAAREAGKVISSGQFQLEADLNNVFLAGSTELIWRSLPTYPGAETVEGYTFVPSAINSVPKYTLTDYLLNAFETKDKRKIDWTNANIVNGVSYTYPLKYKKARTTGAPTESYGILRLAEQYLIRAEAEAQQGQITSAQADLNMIRQRAGLSNTTATEKASMLTAIAHERQVELFCEWGNRWFDLKRNNRADAVLKQVKPNWKSTSVLYPIPQIEIAANPRLTQNPGY